MTLNRYTWDQAAIIGAWSPNAFQAVGINPATIRKWASRGHIHPIGIGPNGARLYDYQQVVRHADRQTRTDTSGSPTPCVTL